MSFKSMNDLERTIQIIFSEQFFGNYLIQRNERRKTKSSSSQLQNVWLISKYNFQKTKFLKKAPMHVQLVYPHTLHEALSANLVVRVQFPYYCCSINCCNCTDIALDPSCLITDQKEVILPLVSCPLYKQRCFRGMVCNRKKTKHLSLELHTTEAAIAFARKLSSISSGEAALQNQKTDMEEHVNQTRKSKANSRNQSKLTQQQCQHQTRGNWILFSSPPSVS